MYIIKVGVVRVIFGSSENSGSSRRHYPIPFEWPWVLFATLLIIAILSTGSTNT
jgi:hypothetical protein